MELEFNEIVLTVWHTSSPGDVVAEYHRLSDERRAAYLASPEYKELRRQAEERTRQRRAVFDDFAARAPAKMTLLPGMASAYAAYIEKCDDLYSARCVSYGEDWGRFMEAELAAGKKLVDVWKACSHAADYDGISGFMYGCAAQTLGKFWVHGDELRRLHNKDYGIDEEQAKGGTVNPAVLRLK